MEKHEKRIWVSLTKYIKIGISIGFLGILLYKVDWGRIQQHISVTDLTKISLVFFILIAQFPISTYKWKKSLEIFQIVFPFLFLQKVLCIGFFINSFLPTTIGGDGYRALKTMPSSEMKSLGVSAILLERILGFAILVFLGLVGAITILMEYQTPDRKMFLLAGVLAGVILVFLMFFIILRYILHGNDPTGRYRDIVLRIRQVDLINQNIQYLRNGGNKLFQLIQYSFVFQMLAILSIYMLFGSIGVNIGIADCAFIAAFAGIASVLPISINGIGVVEGSLVFSALQVGIIYDDAVIVAFMLRILTTFLTLTCGIVYLYDSGKT
jgi:uncharacterized protein (TIRG00374 family)